MSTNAKHARPLTYRQMRAIECWIRGGRKSKARAIREAGYGKSISRQPHKIFDSPAVQRELLSCIRSRMEIKDKIVFLKVEGK